MCIHNEGHNFRYAYEKFFRKTRKNLICFDDTVVGNTLNNIDYVKDEEYIGDVDNVDDESNYVRENRGVWSGDYRSAAYNRDNKDNRVSRNKDKDLVIPHDFQLDYKLESNITEDKLDKIMLNCYNVLKTSSCSSSSSPNSRISLNSSCSENSPSMRRAESLCSVNSISTSNTVSTVNVEEKIFKGLYRSIDQYKKLGLQFMKLNSKIDTDIQYVKNKISNNFDLLILLEKYNSIKDLYTTQVLELENTRQNMDILGSNIRNIFEKYKNDEIKKSIIDVSIFMKNF